MQTESLKESFNEQELPVEVIGKLTADFEEQLNVKEDLIEEEEQQQYDDEDGDEYDEEEEFSFACGIDAPPVAAEEVFYNGQIRPLFPLFNQKLLLSDDDLEKLKERSPVKKVFIQTEENPASSSSPEDQEIVGPYCEWSKNKAIEIEATPEVCNKSNSTGFSRLWRFKDFVHRSNSDGRDAFVFLNQTPAKGDRKNDISGEVKVNEKTPVMKKKKGVVKKSEGVLAHEAYMKSKAKDDDRRRSYLPYRPELVGFFTNVNGGLTKNVHPF